MYYPTATATFFNIDILTTFEDAVLIKPTEDGGEDEDDKRENGEAQEMKPVESSANGEPRAEDGEEHYGNVEVCMSLNYIYGQVDSINTGTKTQTDGAIFK